MARRSASATPTEAPAEVPTEATEEAPVTAVTEDAPTEAATEAPAEAPKASAPEFDLSDFNAAVSVAVEAKDTTTGELAVAAVSPVQEQYRKLDGVKAKNAAKKVLNDAVKAAMNALDIQTARANMQLLDSMSAAGGGTKTEKAPADPTQAFIDRVAGLRLADTLVEQSVPEGVSEDWATKVQELVTASAEPAQTYLTWLNSDAEDKGDEPDVSSIVKAAVKLSQGKSAKVGVARATGGGFTGERRDIGKHIAEAFAGVESGAFLTVAEIRNHKSEEYGDNPPSAGAISARLFPSSGKCTIEGVTPGQNEKGNKGATKD